MPLRLPDLDDRTYQELRREALDEIYKRLDTDWNDLSPGDPGVVLLEAFAYLTEQMIYRLNRLPEKAYVAFLRLLGVRQHPPSAAVARLRLQRTATGPEEDPAPLILPAGTTITTGSGGLGEAPVFRTAQAVELAPGQAVEVNAHHFTPYVESAGHGTGRPGLTLHVAHPPIVAPMGTTWDLKVGVELNPDESAPLQQIELVEGRRFHIWQEVENFANLAPGTPAYVADRLEGTIHFAPAARYASQATDGQGGHRPAGQVVGLAATPAFGREIRVWYPHGGGPQGNVPAGQLNTLVEAANRPGWETISVANEERARGGMPPETVENALIRGPLEIFTMDRAITARDVERLVLSRARHAVLRVYASALQEQWAHAEPGTVSVTLVPLPVEQVAPGRAPRSPDQLYRAPELFSILEQSAGPAIRAEVQALLDERAPIGIRSAVGWARYKRVSFDVVVDLRPGSDPVRAQQALVDSLRRFISPLPLSLEEPGWPFGAELRVANVHHHLTRHSEVELVRAVSVHLDNAPDLDVHDIAADDHQPGTWYVASADRLFRSGNDGNGWELVARAPAPAITTPVEVAPLPAPDGESVTDNGDGTGDHAAPGNGEGSSPPLPPAFTLVRPNPYRAGMVAAVTTARAADSSWRSELYISRDCFDSSAPPSTPFAFRIHDLAWVLRANTAYLLLATDRGLYELRVPDDVHGAAHADLFVPIGVIPGQPNHPLYALAVLEAQNGSFRVAVAAKSSAGVFISHDSSLSSQRLAGAADGEATAFSRLGLVGEDVRRLGVQRVEEKLYLWAGVMARADEGRGCYRWRFDVEELSQAGRATWLSDGWRGGSCLALAFQGANAFAATAWGGVLRLPPQAGQWQAIEPERLPLLPLPRQQVALENERRERNVFVPLVAIASNDHCPSTAGPLLLVGGPDGVYRSADGGEDYEAVAAATFYRPEDTITLPPDWLFVAGEVRVDVGAGRPVMTTATGRRPSPTRRIGDDA